MNVQDNGLRWCKADNGTWSIVGPIAAVIAAAQSGEAVTVTVKRTAVSTDYYDLDDGRGELIIVKPVKAGKVDPSARRLVTAANTGAVVQQTNRGRAIRTARK